MSKGLRIFLNGLIAGLISLATSFTATAANMQPTQSLTEIGQISIAVMVVGGLLTALKDWHSLLQLPPDGEGK